MSSNGIPTKQGKKLQINRKKRRARSGKAVPQWRRRRNSSGGRMCMVGEGERLVGRGQTLPSSNEGQNLIA
jgi:hypothetical protein